MLAEIDHRVGAKAVGQPRIGGEIRMRRHQRRVVIGRFRVEIVAARRLDQHRDVADAKAGYREPAAIEPPRTEERVALGAAPALRYLPLHRLRQAGEKRRILGEGQGFLGRRVMASRCSDRRAAVASARRRPRACRRCGIRRRAAPSGSRLPKPACRARRRCRCGRRGSGNSRARSRPAARPAGLARSRAQLRARSATKATRSATGR